MVGGFGFHARALGALIALLLFSGGCAGVPRRTPRDSLPVSYDASGTEVARAVAARAAGHPGESGFILVDDSASAFRVRVDLVDLAQCTLDIQYFIWDANHTGLVLLERTLEAARRGVRVRILLDDFMQAGMDEMWCEVSAHPNVEVRLFNPFGSRHLAYIRRPAEFLARLSTLNHRMHNKLLAADGALALIGGRNIGDQYFGVGLRGYNHRDLDVLCAGPVAEDLTSGFDAYWESPYAVPIEAFWRGALPTPEEVEEGDRERRATIAAWSPWPYLEDPGPADEAGRLARWLDPMVWAPGRAYTDPPLKIRKRDQSAMAQAVWDFSEGIEEDVLLVTPYYGSLDRKHVQRALEAADARGVHLRVLTNSLDSIDGPWGHVGYARARLSLVERGVEVHELRPDADLRARHAAWVTDSQEVVLHAKVAVADCRRVFLGTMNLDLRSMSTNTEAAVIVESPKLALRTLEAVTPDFLPQNSWRVELGGRAGGRCGQKVGDDDLVWLSEKDGVPVCQTSEPGGGSLSHLVREFFSLFPIERVL